MEVKYLKDHQGRKKDEVRDEQNHIAGVLIALKIAEKHEKTDIKALKTAENDEKSELNTKLVRFKPKNSYSNKALTSR